MMFSRFFRWLGKTVSWGFQQTWTLLKQYFIGFWALISLVFYFLLQLLDYPIKIINWVISSLDGQELPIGSLEFGSGGADALAIANTFFPLDEFCRYFVGYCLWLGAWAAYRKIKGWIPTLAE